MTHGCNAGVATSRPSTADRTDTAGVKAPSAYSNAAPKIPSTIINRRGVSPRARRLPFTNAISASTPPSPLLSARMITTWYLIVTIRINDQKINDKTPNTLPGVTGIPCGPWNASRIAYSGLVPMSPYTTPSANSESRAR